MTEVVFETLRAEFSDAIDPAQITRIAVRLLLAALLGGALGYERERSGQAAGIRTHMRAASWLYAACSAARMSGSLVSLRT